MRWLTVGFVCAGTRALVVGRSVSSMPVLSSRSRPAHCRAPTCGNVGDSGVGEAEVERRALVLFAVDPDLSAVALDDPADDREADARALELVRGVQPLEHAEQLVHVLHVE